MLHTTELDTTKEVAPVNGHDIEWLQFDDDSALLRHVLDQKPAEKLEPIPEWRVKILCRELDAKSRIKAQLMAYDEETKLTDYRKPDVFAAVVLAGCYNATTGRHFFTESHRNILISEPKFGRAVAQLALTVLQVSDMISNDAERTKKNNN